MSEAIPYPQAELATARMRLRRLRPAERHPPANRRAHP